MKPTPATHGISFLKAADTFLDLELERHLMEIKENEATIAYLAARHDIDADSIDAADFVREDVIAGCPVDGEPLLRRIIECRIALHKSEIGLHKKDVREIRLKLGAIKDRLGE